MAVVEYVEVEGGRESPDPIIHFRVTIPDKDVLFSVRLFDQSRRMELHLNPKKGGKSASNHAEYSGYWCFCFRGDVDKDSTMLAQAKRMMRLIERLTLGMPAAWFQYRNYYTSTPNIGNEGSQSDAPPRAG